MERLEISKLYASKEDFGGKEITVCGWVKTIRDSKAIGFMEINDGSYFKGLQVVFESEKVENYNDIAKLNDWRHKVVVKVNKFLGKDKFNG